MTTHYDVLMVSEDVHDASIKKAYKKLVVLLQLDQTHDASGMPVMLAVNVARDRLLNKRSDYNRRLHVAGQKSLASASLPAATSAAAVAAATR